MTILLKCFRKLKRYNSFTIKDRLFLIRVFFITGIFRIAILYIPFTKLKNYMGKFNKESNEEISIDKYKEAARIAWAIRLAAKYTPWQSKCLVQSLTAQYLLTKQNISSTLYLGISKEKILNSKNIKLNDNQNDKSEDLIAHSWIRCGSLFVTGGNGEHYAVVAKFSKEF